MRIGLTGATGTLGRLVKLEAVRRDHAVSAFQGDVCDGGSVREWIEGTPIDVVVHLAAVVETRAVETYPARAFAVNVGGTINLLRALAETEDAPWLFLASSSHVYASRPGLLSEEDEVAPRNQYGVTKWLAEQIVSRAGPPSGVPWCIGRIFSFYHASQSGSFLYPTLRRRFETEDLSAPFHLSGANDVRDLSNAEAIADAIVGLAENRATGIVNIGSGVATRIADFVQAMAPAPLRIIDVSDRPPTSLVADTTRLKRVLG